jgi:hypothetical protein
MINTEQTKEQLLEQNIAMNLGQLVLQSLKLDTELAFSQTQISALEKEVETLKKLVPTESTE